MKQLAYIYPNRGIEMRDVPEPQITGPTDVKIRLEYCAICGSDVHIVTGAFDHLYDYVPEGTALPLGHEASGVVVETGSGCATVKVGDRVTYNNNKSCGKCYQCRNHRENLCSNPGGTQGGMGEYVIADESQVYLLPEGISLREGCLAEPVSIAMHTVQRADIQPGQSVAIFGGGPIGMLTLQLSRLSGAYPIALMDVVPEKLKMALDVGADYAFSSASETMEKEAREITEGRGFDVVIECSGALSALDAAYKLVAPGGTLVMASVYRGGATYQLELDKVFNRELTIKSVFLSPGLFDRSVRILNRLETDKIITGEYPLAQFENAFQAHRSGKHIKVIFKIQDEERK